MSKPPCILVFGEDGNDIAAIRELILALRGGRLAVEKRRAPMVLVKGIDKARDRKNLAEIAKVVRAERRGGRRCAVVAHRDCDACEPAHEDVAQAIEQGLTDAGITDAVAAVAAWEIEAWWFLWPDAALAVNSKWRRPEPPRPQVGQIQNAKEVFRRALRPVQGKPPREYCESDSPAIARKVRELAVVDSPQALSQSFDRFARRVRRLKPA